MEAAETIARVARSWDRAFAENMDSRLPHALLIVQRNQLAARSLRRYLGPYFHDVSVASSREDAERLLQENAQFTHLLCGDDLGTSEPRGCELIAAWRRAHPEICRAVLATATEMKKETPSGVDAVFEKPAEPSQLLELLGITGARSALSNRVS
jgi:CheY-like chemotaxis protein